VVRFGYAFSVLDVTLAWRMLLRYPGLMPIGLTWKWGVTEVKKKPRR
jgi:hypothetical protein